MAAWPHLPSGDSVNAALLQAEAISASGAAGSGFATIDAMITGSVALMPGADGERPTSTGFARAADALAAKDYAAAYRLASGLPSKAERLAIQWAAIYYGGADFGRSAVSGFLADPDGFPVATVFQTRLEQALLREKPDTKTVITVLGGAMPTTLAAQIALAEAYIADGQKDRAGRIARTIWTGNFLDADEEKLVRARLGSLLTAEMHWDRAVYLMMHDRASAVERIMSELSPAQRTLATARNAVSRNGKDAKKLLDSVDPSLTKHPVFLFSRAQRARQFELWDDAIAFLDRAGAEVPESAEWWYERRLLTRQLLALGDPERAYKAAAGYTEGPDGRLVDAQFHAGWIALSFLKDAPRAARHFAEMARHATLPDTVTQSHYWLARAEKAAGNNDAATAALDKAAGYTTVFYGQLARDELGKRPVELRPMPDVASASAFFEATDRARAVRLLAGAGQISAATILLRGIAMSLEDAGQLAAAARMAQSLGAHNLAIQIAETAEGRGMPLDLFSFPRDGLPTARLAEIDHAAVYAVTRQESRFQLDAISVAGARGLMQLMPGTARETAKKVGESYSAQRLTSDGAYNALLGSTYLADQLRRFDGSLLLAAAAYNAGAGNVNKWIAAYGDPRKDNVDPVVWIELIPFLETRRYVQRVLGNYLVYRARLGDEVPPLTAALRRLPG
ncbi:soluble lytic murein transglycosylase [Devosia enhydra]|uniref:Soluble lytic murein transglycosylase n=2 Tax=Devosia enhydra TaxID=665118 RepID=A0A1K2HT90_9HYPH|nr:soluble lytic murein transglycosylase [Devosia enhydra]